MPIVIAGWVDVAEEKRAAALKEAEPLIDAAREEPGCVAYDWSADPYNPQRIHVFEEWSGEAELKHHFNEAPYKQMLAHLGGVGIIEAKTKKYRVDHDEPVYDPEGVPRADFFSAPA